MKILFLAHRIPFPPNKGDKIRSFFILKYLSQNHDIYLACLIDDKHDLKYQNDLKKYCKEVKVALVDKPLVYLKMLLYLIIGKPITLAYFGSANLQRSINKWLNQKDFDMVYAYSSSVAQYVLKNKELYKVMDYVDVDSDKWFQNAQFTSIPMSLIYKIEGLRMRKYEKIIAQNVQHCIFVTERDERLFRTFIPDIDATVIPNGVNLEYFSDKLLVSVDSKLPNDKNDSNIIFTGAMDYFANVDGVLYFYREIYPLIKAKIPEVKFYIIGNNPAKKINELKKDKSIIVTGRVEDIRPYLQNSAVYVAPLRISRGIQNKVLEAMSMGVPVITTSNVLEGIKAEPGKNIFAEDAAELFANRVIELLQNTVLRNKIGKAGREFVELHHNWKNAFVKLDNLIENLNAKRNH